VLLSSNEDMTKETETSLDRTEVIVLAVILIIGVLFALVMYRFLPFSSDRIRLFYETVARSLRETSSYAVIVTLAAGTLVSLLTAVVPLLQRREEETTQQRISRLTKSLSEALQLITEIGNEIESRRILVSKLENDIKTYEQVAALKQSEVEAIAQVLRVEVREEARRSFWRDFLVKLLFFVMGVVVTLLLKSIV